MLDSVRFEACFRSRMAQICPESGAEHIAIDGKTLRGSRTQDGALHLVTAWHPAR